MASRLFREMAAKSKETKTLDSLLAGSDYLGEGTYDVVIQAVDSSQIEEKRMVTITFDANGKTKNDNIFLFNRENTNWGRAVRNLWAALIPDPAALGKFMEAVDSGDEHAFEMFTGMKLQITTKYGNGFRVHAIDGGYVCKDETGAQVGEIGATVEEAKDNAKAAGGRQAYINVQSMKATNTEENLATFAKALAAKAKAPTSVFSVGKTI